MIAGRCSAARLPVDENIRTVVKARYKVVYYPEQLLARVRKVDADKTAAVVEAFEMLVDKKRLSVMAECDIVNTVAEINRSVLERYLYILDGGYRSVVICCVFHSFSLRPPCRSLAGICIISNFRIVL